jgi:integrase
MQILTKEQAYFNFINSISSEHTKKMYAYSIEQFLNHCKLDLDSFLKLPVQEITNLVIEYLLNKKASRPTKNVIFFAIKHACEINDVILNWKKIKKFIKSDKTGNETNGRDRGYTHEEIQKILEFSDQRIRTAFLILASTGMRIGALGSLKISDLEKIDDLYKVSVYSGDNENYITFTTPECTKEIDSYLEFRKRRGEKITKDSYLIIKRFSKHLNMEGFKGKPFSGDSLKALLQDSINNSGLREIDTNNRYKRKEVPLFHGFRKFVTKQLVDSKVNPEIREMLLGHKIGLTGAYYKPTVQDMLDEYLKAVPLLTISDEDRLQFKYDEKVKIEKSQYESLKSEFEKFKDEVMKMKNN